MTDLGAVIKANTQGEKALTNEPLYQGEPILAVAAVDELTAAEAIEAIDIEFEPLPFVVDPLESLRPGGPNARTMATSGSRPPGAARQAGREAAEPSATAGRRTEVDRAQISPTRRRPPADGQGADEWSYGDVDAGLQERRAGPRRNLRRRRTPAIRRSRRAPRWPTGRTASCSSTGRRRARCRPWPVGTLAGHGPQPDRPDQRVHRRRLRQQGHRLHLADHPGAAVEEGQRAGDDAHQPRGRALHRPRASRRSGPDEGRLRQGRPDHRARHVRHLEQRSLRRERRCQCFGKHRLARVSAARRCAGAA